jgi:hypothetical protein
MDGKAKIKFPILPMRIVVAIVGGIMIEHA